MRRLKLTPSVTQTKFSNSGSKQSTGQHTSFYRSTFVSNITYFIVFILLILLYIKFST